MFQVETAPSEAGMMTQIPSNWVDCTTQPWTNSVIRENDMSVCFSRNWTWVSLPTLSFISLSISDTSSRYSFLSFLSLFNCLIGLILHFIISFLSYFHQTDILKNITNSSNLDVSGLLPFVESYHLTVSFVLFFMYFWPGVLLHVISKLVCVIIVQV